MIYRFGLFEFDPAAGELRKQGRVVRIEPQPARALALLLAHPGAVISREQLRAHVWEAGTHVDFDRGLAYCVGQVRTALGDSADNPRFVETLPRRGYRFIAPVQAEEAASERREAASAPLIVDRQENAAAPSPVGGAATPPVAHGARWAVILAILVAGAVGWTAWARMAPARPLVAVAIFDNETGDLAFDRLATTAADIMVERLTALGTQRIGVIGNTPSPAQVASATRSRGSAARDRSRVLRVRAGSARRRGRAPGRPPDPAGRCHAPLGDTRGSGSRRPGRYTGRRGGPPRRGGQAPRDRARPERPSVHAITCAFPTACLLRRRALFPRWRLPAISTTTDGGGDMNVNRRGFLSGVERDGRRCSR